MLFLTLCLLAVLCVVVTYAVSAAVARVRAAQAPKIHPAAFELAGMLIPSWPTISAKIAATGVPTCEVAEKPLTEKLKRIEADLAEARDERRDALKVRDEARDKFASSDTVSLDSDEGKEAQAAVARVGEADQKIAELKDAQVLTLTLLGRDSAQDAGHSRPVDNPDDPRGDTGGWDAAGLIAKDEVRQVLDHMSTTKSKIGSVELGEVASREVLVADVAGTDSMRRGEYIGVIPALRRRLRVLDLLPTGTMNANTLPYTQETGSFDTARETAESAAKPEAEFTPVDADAVAQTIAHWLKIRKQALSDYPALQAIIEGRLRYGVLRRLEAQVLAGSGVGTNIEGILNVDGIGEVAYSGGALIADQVLKAITTVFLADAEATGVVMHPTDWQKTLIAKASGSGEYLSGGPFEVNAQMLWGVPLVPSRAIPQGTALVGDFEIGAQLFIREGVNVLLSDSDQDDFIRNRVTLLAEMRAALAVFRPAAFAITELGAVAS